MQHSPWQRMTAPALALMAACGVATTTEEDALDTTTNMAAAEATGDGTASAPVRGHHMDPAFVVAMDCSTLTVGGPLREGQGHHGGRGKGHGGGGRGMGWVYDADADGTLSEEEQAALLADLVTGCEARKGRLLAAYDTDGDGALSDAEAEAARADLEAQREARRAEALAAYDANGDGALDGSERQAMREAKRAELLATYDTNGDGSLDDAEKTALAEAIKERIRSGEGPVPHGHR